MPRQFQVHRQIPGMPGMTIVRGVNAPPGSRNMPVMVRNRLGSLGAGSAVNMPNSQGGPGSPVYPYMEDMIWGDGSQGTNTPPIPSLAPADIGATPPALSSQQQGMVSTPYGNSERPWTNPCTYSGFPIQPVLGVTQQILSGNYKRNALIIQNTSTATAVGDVAPTLYVGFNAAPGQSAGSLALPPGLGFFWGASDPPPRDSISVVYQGGANGGGTVVITGAVIQGTYSP